MSKNYPSFIKHNFGGNNIFRLVGLWEFGIPTLEEYSQLVTPSYYYLTSRLLNRPIDYQSRNFVLISKINGPVLKMMGVRFIISDKQLETLAGYNQVALQTGIYGGQLFLYSTDDYNSGGYSPTRWQKIATGKEMIDVLARQSDFGEAVVTDVELPNNLARIVQVRMKFDANAVTISGLVQGTGGLLVLPLQFTHCWKIKTASTKARVVPVNLAMAGLLLEQTNPLSNFEVTLHNDFGPFSSGCRQQDIDRNQALRLKEDGTKAIRTDRHPMVQYTW